MIILGISAFVHDSGACLIKDGKLLANIEEERLNRIKHTDAFPLKSIEYVLSAGGVKLSDVDAVAFNWNPWKSLWSEILKFLFFPNLYAKIQLYNKPPKNFKSIAASLRIRQTLKKYFSGTFKGKIYCVDHHLAHAATAYFLSPFNQEDATVLVVDGHGDDCATTAFKVIAGKRFRRLCSWPIMDSLGVLYSNFTHFLGFEEYQEGKTMALASFGNDSYARSFSQVIALDKRGGYRIPNKSFLGLWNFIGNRLPFDLGSSRKQTEPLEQRHYDIACSMQNRVKEAIMNIIGNLADKIPAGKPKNLGLAGGVFLNCDINRDILRENKFKNVFAPPFTSDSGGAAGAALYAAYIHCGEAVPKLEAFSPYLGPEYDSKAIIAALQKNSLNYTEAAKPWIPAASLLHSGKVVGWFQGRIESGPRALGNRSIIANPSTPGIRNHLNDTIKLREGFRPFAPIATPEAAIRYFEMSEPLPILARYMLVTVKVRPEYQKLLAGITHVDGTARIQVVTWESNPPLHSLLVEFGRLSGFEVLVNTSFNRHEPIVCSPEDAASCFVRSGLDALIIGNYIVNKPA